MKRKRKNRLVLVTAIFGALLVLLVWKLFDMTIVKGDYYYDLSKNQRLKEVILPAPRGNIYDRNGVLLAGTRSSFTVQAYKDEVNSLKPKEKNQLLTQLLQYIDEDGVDTSYEFPIRPYAFTYPNEADYFKEEKGPTEKVIDLLMDHDLVGTFIQKIYVDPVNKNHVVPIFRKALNALNQKGMDLPIETNYTKGQDIHFVKNEAYQKLIEEEKLKEGMSPQDLVLSLMAEDRSVIQKILLHPAARAMAYETLKEANATENVQLTPLVFSADLDYVINKASLNKKFPSITLDTDAKKDFITIVEESSLPKFLLSCDVNEDKKLVVPAEKLINELESQDIKTNLTFSVNEDAKSITLSYQKDESTTEEPLERLIRLSLEHDLIADLVVNDDYKYMAERANYANGIYPRISTKKWNYAFETDQADFLERYDLEKGATPEEALAKIEAKYGLEEKADLTAIGILSTMNRIAQQGHYAYTPLTLCYGLSAEAVAKIEENIPVSTGIEVAIVPVRYYPHGKMAAHLLGYIGKIATEDEIQKYVKEEGYEPTATIGKTGVEESFEKTLRGVNGRRTVLIDSSGNRTETIREVSPKPGNNLYLTIDFATQKMAEESVKKALTELQKGGVYESAWGSYQYQQYPFATAGATVAVDPNNGDVLALASYPAYDPNLFVTGISSYDWENLMPKDEDDPFAPRPLWNIATQTAIQPGSTFKMATALAALEKGLTPQQTIDCTGHMKVGDTEFGCWIWNKYQRTHGRLGLYDAIGYSCNYFFYVLGLGYDPNGNANPEIQVTVDDLEAMTKKLGLSERSGIEINIPKETVGSIPSRSGKLEVSKAILRKFLEANLTKYEKEDVVKRESDVKKDIDTILTWLDRGKDMPRWEVLSKLDELGYQGELRLEGERAGLGDIIKYTYLNQVNWKESDSVNMVIGQGQNAYTPIEMARYTSILANGGTKYKLSVVKEIKNHTNTEVMYSQVPSGESIGLKDMGHIYDVQQGMRRSAQFDVGLRLFSVLPFNVGSKTGTAQRGGINPKTGKEYAEYSWSVAYAPFEDPQIAMATLLFQAGEGNNSMTITRDVLAEYLRAKPE